MPKDYLMNEWKRIEEIVRQYGYTEKIVGMAFVNSRFTSVTLRSGKVLIVDEQLRTVEERK